MFFFLFIYVGCFLFFLQLMIIISRKPPNPASFAGWQRAGFEPETLETTIQSTNHTSVMINSGNNVISFIARAFSPEWLSLQMFKCDDMYKLCPSFFWHLGGAGGLQVESGSRVTESAENWAREVATVSWLHLLALCQAKPSNVSVTHDLHSRDFSRIERRNAWHFISIDQRHYSFCFYILILQSIYTTKSLDDCLYIMECWN